MGFALGGPPCAALERREFLKSPTLKSHMILALVLPTKRRGFGSLSLGRSQNSKNDLHGPPNSGAPINKSSPPYSQIVVDPSGVRFVTWK